MNISVIIPTYKPKDYLNKCLFSLGNQTLSEDKFEIIIILNGDVSSYRRFVENSIRKYLKNNIVILETTELANVSNARNIGISRTKGDYIAFIDDDDFISNFYLEELYKIAQKGYLPLSNFVAFYDTTNIKDPSNYISKKYDKEKKRNRIKKMQVRPYLSISYAKLIPSSFVKDTRFNLNFKNGEDILFMFAISNRLNHFKFTSPDAIYYRRYRENSAITKPRSALVRFYELNKLYFEYINIWRKAPFKYNFIFFITRLLASTKGLIYVFCNKKT